MKVTFSLDDELVREVNKIAVERDTTLTGLVRSYLEQLAAENAASRRKRRETLDRTFDRHQFAIGKPTWTRAELHDRS